MRIRVISAIARKELRCFCASRRTVINTLLVSLVMVPGLLMFGSWAGANREGGGGGPLSVGVGTEQLLESLGHVEGVSASLVTDEGAVAEMLRKGEIDAYVESRERGYVISYSGAINASVDTASAFKQMLEESLGETASDVTLTDVSKNSTDEAMAYTFIPAGLMVVCSMSAGFLAIAATVREREAGTFEPLFSTGISRGEIVAGKMAAVLVGACVSTALGLGGTLGYTAVRMPEMHIISGDSLPVLAMACAAASALFVFVFVAVGMVSRSVREAQSYIGVVSSLAMVPSIFLSTAKVGSAGEFWPVPVLNISAVVRDALHGVSSGRAMAMSALVCLALGVVACATSIAGTAIEPLRRAGSRRIR